MGRLLQFQPDGEQVMIALYGPRGGLRDFIFVRREDLIEALRKLEVEQ